MKPHSPARGTREADRLLPRPAPLVAEHPSPPTSLVLCAGAALAIAIALTYQLLREHPVTTAGLTFAIIAAAATIALIAARLKDRRARRSDPQGPGLVIGTVRRPRRLARPRPFVIPWDSFHQHVLIDGPTGAGKTFAFVIPILRAFSASRRSAGVLYLDGKGDRVDHSHGIDFDHVFCPEDPAESAHWNPLAGDEPFTAAAQFAAALFPEALEPVANFYEAKAVYTITKVVPAMALTGFATDTSEPPEQTNGDDPEQPLEHRLRAAGLSAERAAYWSDTAPGAAERQLAGIASDGPTDPTALERAIEAELTSPAASHSLPDPTTIAEVTPAALNRVLFADGQLKGLAEALARRIDLTDDGDQVKRALEQLRHDVAAIAHQGGRDRAAVFQSLQNRLGYFLSPPFLDLCSRSDVRIADVANGARLAFLLPTGAFPAAAKPLGRVALAQFKNAVLSSRPRVRKLAVLDEFHNFVSDDWSAFLNQARSRGGGAVMAIQSLADLPPDTRDGMLANARTVIVTPGCGPRDAEYWADAFGSERRRRRSLSYGAPILGLPQVPTHVRVDEQEEPRWTPTAISELDPGHALIRVTHGRIVYPVAKVRVERD